ncbi:ankyrin repeat family A protein 2-like isoform X2 [Ornithodoros turicata]|uniref:ankyrin repeat family A protein 2-like isoform X2 n=1 Tax=Ornithodoros turicata TaxID=34597 RepID=UPI0031391506
MPHVCPETSLDQSRLEGSSALQGDANRSAFTPYKSSTVLTNLQRGNVPTQTPAVPQSGDRIELADEAGLTPLLWASAHGQMLAVRLLLGRGAAVHAQGKHGETALLLAASNGHSHVVRQLLQHGANPDQADLDGNTPLMYAAMGNHLTCAQELLSCGADISAQNNVFDTAYDLSVLNGAKQVQQAIDSHILKLLQ